MHNEIEFFIVIFLFELLIKYYCVAVISFIGEIILSSVWEPTISVGK